MTAKLAEDGASGKRPKSTVMDLALDEARDAADRGEVPVGAVIVDAAGTVLAQAGNRTLELLDPTAHAEMLALRAASAALGSERLTGCDTSPYLAGHTRHIRFPVEPAGRPVRGGHLVAEL